MKQADKRRQVYNHFVEINEKYITDREELYNFRCSAGRLLNSIPNYEFWANERNWLNAINSFRLLLIAYNELKDMNCRSLPKLSEMCKHTSYIKSLF